MSDFSTGSTPQPNAALRHIYDLIVSDQQPAALDQLKPYLAEHPDDAEGWWLMANAVPDIPAARQAIENVLRIEPNHVQAQELRDQLDAAEAEQYFNTDLFSDVPSRSITPAKPTAALDPMLPSRPNSPIPTAQLDSSFGEPSTDTPDWLRDFGTPAASSSPDLALDPTGEVPDWLKAMDSSTASDPVASTTDAQAGATALDDDLDSWFNSPSEVTAGDLTQNTAADQPENTPAAIPDWLQAAAPAAADLTVDDTFPVGQTRDLSGANLPDWLNAPTASAAAQPSSVPTQSASMDDLDLAALFDQPGSESAYMAAASTTQSPVALSDEDLSSWFDVPADQNTVPVGSLNGTNDETVPSSTAGSMPDWLMDVAPAETVTAAPIMATDSEAASADLTDPFATPEIGTFNQTPDETALPDDWLTTEGPFTTPATVIEQDVVPSFVQQDAGRFSNGTATRDFSVSDDERTLIDAPAANLAKDAAVTAAAGSSRPVASAAGTNSAIPVSTQPIQPIQRPATPMRRFPLLLLIALLLIVVLAIVLIPRFITQAPTTSTSVAVLPTNVTSQALGVVTSPAATGSSVEATAASTRAVLLIPATESGTALVNGAATLAATESAGTTTSEVAALPTNGAATSKSTTDTAATSPVTQAATTESFDSVIAALPDQLSAAGIPTPTVAIKDSSAGKAITVSFCQPFGPNVQKNAYAAMDVLAAQVASFAGQADAIAVEVHGCGTNAPVEYRAVVPVTQAVAYINKQIDIHQFRASWLSN